MIHVLKCDPEMFDLVWKRLKSFEVRRDDRPFSVDDRLLLADGEDLETAVRFIAAKVSCVLRPKDHAGIAEGYAVLGLWGLDWFENNPAFPFARMVLNELVQRVHGSDPWPTCSRCHSGLTVTEAATSLGPNGWREGVLCSECLGRSKPTLFELRKRLIKRAIRERKS